MILCPLQNDGVMLGTQWIQKRPYITQEFGRRPEVYKQFGMLGHNGLDFRAKVGTKVFAPFEGIAKVLDDKTGYGLHIKIRKGNLECVLGHLSASLIKDGELVHMGDYIALTGNTGFSTAPHLHFGLRYLNPDGTVKDQGNGFAGYVDPTPFMLSWKGSLTKSTL